MVKKCFVLAALILITSAQSGWAIIMHDAAQNDPAWQQEYKALGQQYTCVVGLAGYNGTSWQNIGSGTVISGNCVLGAGHSALFNNGAKFEKYAMITGNHLLNDYWGIYYTSKVDVIPGYTGSIADPDMAIWTFDQTITGVPLATLFRGSDTALLGSVVDLVGFGKYGYPSTGSIALDGAKRGCQQLLFELGDGAYGAGPDQLISAFGIPGGSMYLHLGGTGAYGDSGGGMFVGGQQVGVLDYGLGSSYPYAGATSVSQHAAWIDSIVVPEPSTLVMLGAAASAFLVYRRRRS
jgi:hypothetical protein